MIKQWYITGDTHGDVTTRVWNMLHSNHIENPEEAGLIILGDAGINFYLNKTDKKLKKRIEDMGAYVYCVRGNHEARPQNVEGMLLFYDENTESNVYYEPEFPHIRYFIDGLCYKIAGFTALTIGGAYSVDKEYRLLRNAPWFADELLSADEMDVIENLWAGQKVDFVLTHTCPLSWEPIDLFLNFIDQSTVDKSMEIWLDKFKDKIQWTYWLFGHYHADRLVRPRVEMFFRDIMPIEDIVSFWEDPQIEGLERDPCYGE